MQVVHLSDAYGGRCGRIGERYENSYVFLAKLQRKIAVCYLIRSIKPLLLEEKVGFEPTVPCGTPDFESGTFGHSATSPHFVAQIVPAPCNPDCKGFSLITAGVGLAFLRSHTSPRHSKSIINCPKASYFIG